MAIDMAQAYAQPASQPGLTGERSQRGDWSSTARPVGTTRSQSLSPSSTDTEDEALGLSPNRLAGSNTGPELALSAITESADEAINHPMYGRGAGNSSDLESLREGEDEVEQEPEEEEEDRHAMERLQIGGGISKEASVKSGYLLKRGERSKVVGRTVWKKRYFVLRPDRLCYYKDDREYQILRHVAVAEVHACAEIAVKKHDNSFGIVTPKRTYYVKANSPQEMHDWVQTINRVRQDQVDLRDRAEEREKEKQQQQQQSQDERRHQRRASARMAPAANSQTIQQQQLPQPIPTSTSSTATTRPQNIIGMPAPSPSNFASSFSPSETSSGMSPIDSGGAYLSSSYASNSSDLYTGNGSVNTPGHFGPGGLELGGLSESESLSASAAEPDKPFTMRARSQSNAAGSGTGLGNSYFPPAFPPSPTGVTGSYGGNPNLAARTPLLSSSEEDDDHLISGTQTGQEGNTPLATPLSPNAASASATAAPTHPQHALLTKSALTADPTRIICNGYLMKQGKRKNWRKRWFVLTSQKLTYSRSHMDYKINRAIPLDSVLDVMEYVPAAPVATTRARPVSFSGATSASLSGPLSPSFEGHINQTSHAGGVSGAEHGSPSSPAAAQYDRGQSNVGGGGNSKKQLENCFKIITPSRTFLVCCPSEDDEIRWLSALRVLIDAGRRTESKMQASTKPTSPPSQAQPQGDVARHHQQQHISPSQSQQIGQGTMPVPVPSISASAPTATNNQSVITQASQTPPAASGNDSWQAGGNYPSIESKLEEARIPSSTAYSAFTDPDVKNSNRQLATSSIPMPSGVSPQQRDNLLPNSATSGGNATSSGPVLPISQGLNRDYRTAVA